MRVLTSAPWRSAPLMLFRHPALVAATFAVGSAVGLAATAGPLFVSSVGSAMVAEDLSAGCPRSVGLRVTAVGTLNGEYGLDRERPEGSLDVRDREASLRALLDANDLAGEPELTAIGPTVEADLEGHARVRLVHREGIETKVDVLASTGGRGVWLSETAAGLMGAGAGAVIRLRAADRSVQADVAGVYRDLGLPLDAAWCSLARLAYPAGLLETPQSLMLADRQTYDRLERTLGQGASELVWEVPIEAAGLGLPQATRDSQRMERLSGELAGSDSDDLRAVSAVQATVRLPAFVAVWQSTATSVRSGVLPVTIVTVAVGILFVVSLSKSWSEENHGALAFLVERGVAPLALAVKASLELAPVLLAGVGAGAALAVRGVQTFGPSNVLDGDGARLATAITIATLASAVGAIVVTVVAQVARIEESRQRRRLRGALLLEMIVAAAAAASWWRIAAHGEAIVRQQSGAPRVDPLLVIFPVLAITGLAALTVRALMPLLPIARRRTTTARMPVWLAARRLADGGPALRVLACSATTGVGLFIFAATIAASVSSTLEAKATRFVGADVAVRMALPVDELPVSLEGRATVVGRWLRAELDGNDVEVLGIDPASFADGAYWHDSLAPRSLDDLLGLLARLDRGDRSLLPVIATTGSISSGTVRLGAGSGAVDVPVEVVAVVDAFPGGRSATTPLLIGDLERLRALREPSMGEVWGHGRPAELLRALDGSAEVWGDVSAEEVLGVGSFRVTSWTFGFLRDIAGIMSVMTAAGLLAQISAQERRSRLGGLLAARFGLRRVTNVAAHALQLVPVLIVASAIGVISGIGTALAINPRLDALTRLAPLPLVSVPVGVLSLALAALTTTLLIGCFAVQRFADRVRIVEVLRADG